MEAPIDVSKVMEPEKEATSLMIKSFWDAVVSSNSTFDSVSHTKKNSDIVEIVREPVKSTTFNIVIPIIVLLLAILLGLFFVVRDPKKHSSPV